MKPKREPVVVVMSILAGLQFLFAGMGGIGFATDNERWSDVWQAVAAIGMLATAAVAVGAQFYIRGQVSPVEDVDPPGVVDGSLGVPNGVGGQAVTRSVHTPERARLDENL